MHTSILYKWSALGVAQKWEQGSYLTIYLYSTMCDLVDYGLETNLIMLKVSCTKLYGALANEYCLMGHQWLIVNRSSCWLPGLSIYTTIWGRSSSCASDKLYMWYFQVEHEPLMWKCFPSIDNCSLKFIYTTIE